MNKVEIEKICKMIPELSQHKKSLAFLDSNDVVWTQESKKRFIENYKCCYENFGFMEIVLADDCKNGETVAEKFRKACDEGRLLGNNKFNDIAAVLWFNE